MKIVSIINSSYNHAGYKAQDDIIQILKDEYKSDVEEITLDLNRSKYKNKILNAINLFFLKIKFIFKITITNDWKIFQYPMSHIRLISFFAHKKSIIIVHDLRGIRYQNEKIEKKEVKLLKKFMKIIVHNSKMKQYLVNKGVNEKNVYTLELFDYLAETSNDEENRRIGEKLEIDYIGNLVRAKCPFIYKLKNDNKYILNLYGNGINKNINDMVLYKGVYAPNELPNKLQGNFGLVWDGDINEDDENISYKNYTKYNNPHKFSCYIAAGMPVIVWKKAAIREFVEKYNIGYTINELADINKIDFCDYDVKIKNVKELSKKVREGYFTRKVFNEILKDLHIIIK